MIEAKYSWSQLTRKQLERDTRWQEKRGSVIVRVIFFCIVIAVICDVPETQAQKPQRQQQQQTDARPPAKQERDTDEVEIVLSETFVNGLLGQMFALGQMPSFPIGENIAAPENAPRTAQITNAESGFASTANVTQSGCASEIMVLREVAGERTRVRFADGRIGSTVAFQGNYNARLVGCLRFQGTAQALIDLVFDENRQTLVAHVSVQRVDLVGVPALLGGVVTGVVQSALDARIKEIDVLRADQLAAQLPLSNGRAVRLRANRVRSEIVNGELRLRIKYGVERVQ